MLPDRVSNPGPLTYESGALPIALRGPANREIARFTGLVQNSSGQMDFCRSLVLDKFLQ